MPTAPGGEGGARLVVQKANSSCHWGVASAVLNFGGVEADTERDAERLKRLLLSLPELELRVRWLGERFLRWPVETTALRLERLCAASERSEPDARTALLAVACYFAAHGETELVQRLRAVTEVEHLLSLGRMLRWGRSSRACQPNVSSASHEIPDYGAGRELTVGERRSLARRSSRVNIDRLLEDPHPLVMRELLLNPSLVENDVVRLAARRPAHTVAMEALARSTFWLCRSRVRLSLVQNPGAPRHISGALVVVCDRGELQKIAINTMLPRGLRTTARELLARRPPLAAACAEAQRLQ